ncbi:hypothetical protein ABL840_09085 [Variovorax sp. NFACC27]|uniref:hypothetical protein n=1 Tax=unclassified Variovorax TaxID=663243 RepID=UPI00089A1D84|nr:hypothetical protein SAMN03159371_05280 [Variovorax sp. NFACC28]SEG89619.1 hypothetical protein SAMN03159365_05167 [Variovorax sp. NFACC29]SFD40466.1 hypothetical protein SAMN03159379_05170 [Variovorax sp. NFACC26]SFG42704.1 hypothetical protein SAMN03159447_03280 [Variovorax sp. NFACC27]
MNCLNCSNWSLKHSPLRVYGFGTCKAAPVAEQACRTFSALNECRIGKFTQAPADTVAKREKVIA